MMDHRELIEKILDRSKEVLDEAEVYVSVSENLSIDTFQGEISKYEIAESGGLSLRGIYKGNMGYCYTEKLDESSIDYLIENVVENSKYLEGDEEIIFEGSTEYEDFMPRKSDIDGVSIEDKIELLLELEEEIKNGDPRITEVMAYYSEFKSQRFLANSKGLRLTDKNQGGVLSASSVAKEGDETKTGSSYRLFKKMKEIEDIKTIAKEVVDDAISQFGARSVASDEYPVLIENDTFSSLLASFHSIFVAENIQKDMSLLKGKIGEKIAVDNFSIVDDPFIEDGFGSKMFDGEGTATRYKKLIDQGILKEYLYNWKTAKKDGVESSGNASRSYKGRVGISSSNFFVEKGDISIEELLDLSENGIFIDNLQGLHSGLNAISGDFSLSASGYKIKDGKLDRPVNQITIAGNFFELLMDIEAIGSDFKFSRNGGGTVGSPSILINKLAISGN